MKVAKALDRVTTTQSELARVLGITQPRVSQLAQDGIVLKDDGGAVLAIPSIINFYKSRLAADIDGDELDYMQERARHEKVKREIAELKLAKMEQRAYDAKVVELVMTEMLSNLRTQLLGLPSKLAPQLEGKDKDEVYGEMTREIEEKLSELSEYSPDLFAEEIEEAADEDRE